MATTGQFERPEITAEDGLYGTTVRYHGTLIDQHGLATVVGRCTCSSCGQVSEPRYVLTRERPRLPVARPAPLIHHVRPSSFTRY